MKIVKNNNDGVDAAAGYGLLMTVIATTAAVIIFGLTLVGMRQGNALLTSTLLEWCMSLPAWE